MCSRVAMVCYDEKQVLLMKVDVDQAFLTARTCFCLDCDLASLYIICGPTLPSKFSDADS
jgi:hypothetical protein